MKSILRCLEVNRFILSSNCILLISNVQPINNLADHNKVQTNFFYGENPIYGVNGADTEVGIDTTSGFHKYTIDW